MAEPPTADADEVYELVQVLGHAAGAAPKAVRAVVQKGALNIKRDAQKRVTGLKHAPAYPRAITYDTHERVMSAWAEIGPDKERRQGPLGNILEHGTVNNAPTPHMGPAAETEEPKFRKALEDLAAEPFE